LRHCATHWKVAGSRPEEVKEFFFFSNYLILPAALGRGFYSASNRYDYQESSWGREAKRGLHERLDNLTDIIEPIAW
jgi:hypothetical protein